MPRAKGPFEVRKVQKLGYTEVVIRVAGSSQPRVLTVHDGWHSVQDTAGFFAACEDLYLAAFALRPILPLLRAGIEPVLKSKGASAAQIDEILAGYDTTTALVEAALVKAESPAQSPDDQWNIEWSAPTYEALIKATQEIRSLVGDGTPSAELPGECVSVENQIAIILDGLRPKALVEPDEALVETNQTQEASDG